MHHKSHLRSPVLSRREWMALMASARGLAQGVATRGIPPAPRAKPSGIPFHAYFTDIAAQAGLTAPTIYGGVDRKDYIIEAVGCGVAFFDYDNDGWLDILVLSGTRLDGNPPGATNRLYRNNRDGTFTDVTKKAELERAGWANSVTIGDYNNDGFEDVFITYWGQNVLYRNNGDGTFTDVTKAAGLMEPALNGTPAPPGSTTTATVIWISSWPRISTSIEPGFPSRGPAHSAASETCP